MTDRGLSKGSNTFHGTVMIRRGYWFFLGGGGAMMIGSIDSIIISESPLYNTFFAFSPAMMPVGEARMCHIPP